MATTDIPQDFWKQIQHQLDRLSDPQVDTFDQVREILLDPAYDRITQDVHRNGERTFSTDSAFFAGTGGDLTIKWSLVEAGWSTIFAQSGMYYVMQHKVTGETLTFIEGDVERGNRLI